MDEISCSRCGFNEVALVRKEMFGAVSTERSGVVRVAVTLGKPLTTDRYKTVKTGYLTTLLHQAEVAKPG